MKTTNVKSTLEKIDVSALKTRLKVTDRAVRLSKENKKFPAAWYAVVKDLCDGAGIDCPLSLFSFRDVA